MSWARSVSGPDWADIAQLMSSIEETHQCVVYLVVLHAGPRGSGVVNILCTARPDREWKLTDRESLGTGGKFPAPDHKTMEGAVFEALFQLEIACTKAWWGCMGLWPEGN